MKFSYLSVTLAMAAMLAPEGWGNARVVHGPPVPPPPEDLVPPTLPPPPSSPPSTRRPSLPAPTTSSGNPTLPSGGSPVGTPVRPGRGASAISRRVATTAGEMTWQQWWDLNRHSFGNLRAVYHDGMTVTGLGFPSATSRPLRPASDVARMEFSPLFQQLAHEEKDLRITALVAWARSAGAADAATVSDKLLAYLRTSGMPYRETAILALGTLGSDVAREPLRELLINSRKGRSLARDGGSVSEEMRSFAALAYALCGGSPEVLQGAFEQEGPGHVELRSAIVMALGMLARDPLLVERVQSFLLATLREPAQNPRVRAHVPLALASAGSRTLVPELVQCLQDPRSHRELRQSCASAIGLLVPEMDAEVFAVLARTAQTDRDATTRHLSIMAIGEMLSRDPFQESLRGEDRQQLIDQVTRFYAEGLSRGSQAADEPWCALSAGIFLRAFPRSARALGVQLSAVAEDAANPSSQAAALLGLGLGRQTAQVALLRRVAREGSYGLLRAYSAEALGLVGDRTSRDAMLELCLTDPSELVRYRAALGVALLADSAVIDPLVAAMEKSRSPGVRAVLAKALGEIGDRRALVGLRELALDHRSDDATRGRALAAIGVTLQGDDVEWQTQLQRGYNLSVVTPSLGRVFQLF